MNKYRCITFNMSFIIMLVFIFSLAVYADEVNKLSVSNQHKTSLGMQIIGDKELPQVLYIIAWKDRTTPLLAGINSDVNRNIFYNPCLFLQFKLGNQNKSTKDWQCLIE